MKKTNRVIIALTVSICFSSAALFLLYTFYNGWHLSRDERFSLYLKKSDLLYGEGKHKAAEKQLLAASRNITGPESWIKLLKRTANIAGKRQIIICASDGGKSFEKLSGREDFTAFSVYASMRTGNTERASKDSSLLESAMYRSIKKEALLGSLLETDDIAPDELLNIYNLTDDARLALDACLVYAKKGLFSNACSVVFELDYNQYPEVAALIAYDSLDLSAADKAVKHYFRLENSEKSPQIQLLSSDIKIMENNIDDAKEILEAFVSQNPHYSPDPFISLSAVYESLNLNGDEILENGLLYFNDNFNLFLKLAESNARKKRTDISGNMILDYIKKNPGVKQMEKMKLDLLLIKIGRTVSRRDIETYLWELFYNEALSERGGQQVCSEIFSGILLEPEELKVSASSCC